MKRWIALALTLMLLTAALGGCGQTPADNGGTTDAPSTDNAAGDQTAPAPPDSGWPEKPITIAIAYSAGGSTDVVNRMLGMQMQEYLGVEVTCINVEGASGALAGQQVWEADSDGYTVFGGLAHSSSGWKMLDYADLSWDNFYGFYAATSPYILFVREGSQYETYEDLIQAIRDNPGQIKWGNAGLGSINHLTGEIFLSQLGVEAISLPYGGGREAAIKVIADEVTFSWAGASDVMDLADTGEIRVLGVVSHTEMRVDAPGGEYVVPSLLDEYPELSALEGLLYWGMAVPRDVPDEVVLKLEEAFQYAVQQQDFIDLCEARYLEPHLLVREEADETSAMLESIYAWGLYDNDLGATGVSPEDFDIPRAEDFSWPPNDRAANVRPWPQG